MSNISPFDSFENAYVLVVDENYALSFECVFKGFGRDFDVLPEKLGISIELISRK